MRLPEGGFFHSGFGLVLSKLAPMTHLLFGPEECPTVEQLLAAEKSLPQGVGGPVRFDGVRRGYTDEWLFTSEIKPHELEFTRIAALRLIVYLGKSKPGAMGMLVIYAVLKTPKPADFRVQEEHGGYVRPVEPDDRLRGTAQAVLPALGEAPLYARVDLVRATDGRRFWLMELELIEPSLYFRMDHDAAMAVRPRARRARLRPRLESGGAVSP